MSGASVERILREIETLSDEERLALDKQLVDQLRVESEHHVQASRDEARRRGIDQVTIDPIMQRRRYRQ